MKYKRLTNNNKEEYNPEYDFCCDCKYYGEPNGCNRWNGECANYERFMEMYDRLAELEDMIEDGRLVEHRIKFNDMVYIPIAEDNKVYKMRVMLVQYGVVVGICGVIKELGKFVVEEDECFFDKEEAEKKLAELKGE